jgi:hypothetical protein
MAAHSAFDMAAPFSVEAAAAAPLHFIYQMTPLVAIATTVSGDARQYAAVSIMCGSLNLWTCMLTQVAPVSKLPYDIVWGPLTIKAGGTFTLSIPTPVVSGTVLANLTIVSPTYPNGATFNATVAIWNLAG